MSKTVRVPEKNDVCVPDAAPPATIQRRRSVPALVVQSVKRLRHFSPVSVARTQAAAEIDRALAASRRGPVSRGSAVASAAGLFPRFQKSAFTSNALGKRTVLCIRTS